MLSEDKQDALVAIWQAASGHTLGERDRREFLAGEAVIALAEFGEHTLRAAAWDSRHPNEADPWQRLTPARWLARCRQEPIELPRSPRKAARRPAVVRDRTEVRDRAELFVRGREAWLADSELQGLFGPHILAEAVDRLHRRARRVRG